MIEFKANDRVKPNHLLRNGKRVPRGRTYKVSEAKKAVIGQMIQLEGFGDFYLSKYFDLVLREV